MVRVYLGTQGGDESKGSRVSAACKDADACARFNGGHNAGHVTYWKDTKLGLSVLPCGVCHEGVILMLASGMVICPQATTKEVRTIEGLGLSVLDRLQISRRAHLVTPWHKLLDKLREEAENGTKIGTTRKGIGPTHETMVSRSGLRMVDLEGSDFAEKLRDFGCTMNELVAGLYGAERINVSAVIDEFRDYRARLLPCICDTEASVHQMLQEGKLVIAEGAQGAMLHNRFGTYPFVTSSLTGVDGALAGMGIHYRQIEKVVGVVKAYTTRVGGGPLVTELIGDEEPLGDWIREAANERGTVTGRDRRIGWLDLVQVSNAVTLNGIDALAISHLDIVGQLEVIKVCTAWKGTDGTVYTHFPPADTREMEGVKPWKWMEFPGNWGDISGCTNWADLPERCKEYVRFIEGHLGVGAETLSVGPLPNQTIYVSGQ